MQTETHWMNGPAALIYLKRVIFPYFARRRKEIGLGQHQKAVLILDTYSSHLTPAFRKLCADSNVLLRYVVPGMTGELQPQDIGINKPFKDHVRDHLTLYFEMDFKNWTDTGKSVLEYEVQLQKSKIGKPVVKALISAYNWLASDEDSAVAAKKRSFLQFEKCYDMDFVEQAKKLKAEGTLYRKVSQRVLEVLMVAAADEPAAVAPESAVVADGVADGAASASSNEEVFEDFDEGKNVEEDLEEEDEDDDDDNDNADDDDDDDDDDENKEKLEIFGNLRKYAEDRRKSWRIVQQQVNEAEVEAKVLAKAKAEKAKAKKQQKKI